MREQQYNEQLISVLALIIIIQKLTACLFFFFGTEALAQCVKFEYLNSLMMMHVIPLTVFVNV